MRIEQAYLQIVKLEESRLAANLQWQSIKLWPLIRQCLWFELLESSPKPTVTFKKAGLAHMRAIFRKTWRYLSSIQDFNVSTTSNAQVLFVSRPVYLQKLPDEDLFDRIVDPLIFSLDADIAHEKFYVSPWPKAGSLHFQARCLFPARTVPTCRLSSEEEGVLKDMAMLAGLDPARFIIRCSRCLHDFVRWYQAGNRLFAGRSELKAIYLTSWYFPDMMGLTAAARQRGISVIDVQHGKQGRYQGMYSGWGNIPVAGYDVMPDSFWCWGKPSCDHILASSPERILHRPFVGGFPWLDYFRQHVSLIRREHARENLKCVLVTTQPPQSENAEPLPDFIIEYLRSIPVGIHFVIRCHPNDVGAEEYCKQRLAGIPDHLFSIDPGKENLYDRLLQSTHHITAYSSCCYEASTFGVPTLLFGMDSKTLYKDEITSGEFGWTEGRVADLATWLDSAELARPGSSSNEVYIESSLARTAELLARD